MKKNKFKVDLVDIFDFNLKTWKKRKKRCN